MDILYTKEMFLFALITVKYYEIWRNIFTVNHNLTYDFCYSHCLIGKYSAVT